MLLIFVLKEGEKFGIRRSNHCSMKDDCAWVIRKDLFFNMLYLFYLIV